MSSYKPQSDQRLRRERTLSGGIMFGQAKTESCDCLSLFVRGEKSLIVSMLADSPWESRLMRFRLDELRALRDAVNKAIEWLEDK